MSDIGQIYKRARFLIIHNPVAGSRKRHGLARARAALAALGAEVTDYVSLCAGDAEVRAKAAASETPPFDGIIAAGGDGTLNEVVNGVAGSGRRVAVGLLPLGTANVFAIETGIPREPDAWARRIMTGATTPVHLGTANGRHFVAMVSAGFDARAVAEVSPVVKRAFGKAAYGLSGLKALMTTAADRLTVSIDGVRHEAGWVIVAKTRAYAGPFELVPTADVARPQLGVALFPVRGVLARLRDLALVGLGRVHAIPGATFLTAGDVHIACAGAMAAQMDGDKHAPLPLTVTPGPCLDFLGIDLASPAETAENPLVSKKTHVK